MHGTPPWIQLKNPKGSIDFNKKVFILDPPQNPSFDLRQVVTGGNEEALAIPHCHHRQFIIIVMMEDPIGHWCQMLH